MKTQNVRETVEKQLVNDLARLLNCTPDTLPASTPKPIAAKFLGLKNWKTLNVWSTTKRHGIVMLKIGRRTEPTTDWLIGHALSGLSIPEEAA